MYHKTASSRTYYRSLRSDLSSAKTEAVISALDRSPVLEILARWPLKEIELSRMESADVSGFYDHLAGKVYVNTIRRWGRSYGEAFSAGKSHRMSKATEDKMESMRRTLLREIAHHLHEIGGEDVAAMAERSFLDPKSSPISLYATINPQEYLAESWIVYNVEGKDVIAALRETQVNTCEPNWDEVRNISERADGLQRSGHMNYETWRSLIDEAEAAAQGDGEYAEFLFRFAESEWIKRLFAEPRAKRSRNRPGRAA